MTGPAESARRDALAMKMDEDIAESVRAVRAAREIITDETLLTDDAIQTLVSDLRQLPEDHRYGAILATLGRAFVLMSRTDLFPAD